MTDDNLWVVPITAVKAGTLLRCDGGFTCLRGGAIVDVKADEEGELYVDCSGPTGNEPGQHRHALDGQLNDACTHYVGFRVAPAAH